MTAALFFYQAIDASSRVIPGASIAFQQGFRPGPVWYDAEMRTPAPNPYITDAAGKCAVYLLAGQQYDITITSPRGDIQQFTHTARADGEVIRETVEVERIVERVVERVVEVPVEIERVIERVVTDPEAETLRARIAELEAKLLAQAKPEPESNPPPEIADLIDPAETPQECFDRLTKLYVEAKQSAELARGYGGTFGGKSVIDYERRAERLESGIKWNRGRLAEQL